MGILDKLRERGSCRLADAELRRSVRAALPNVQKAETSDRAVFNNGPFDFRDAHTDDDDDSLSWCSTVITTRAGTAACSHAHAHTNSNARARTHAHAHNHTRAHAWTRARTHTHTNTY